MIGAPLESRYVPDDEAYIFGGTDMQGMARRCLDAAIAHGYSTKVVRTGDDGFYVPAEVVPTVFPQTEPPPEEGTS